MYQGSVLEQQLVTLVCYPYLAPPANHGLADQTGPLGLGALSACETLVVFPLKPPC